MYSNRTNRIMQQARINSEGSVQNIDELPIFPTIKCEHSTFFINNNEETISTMKKCIEILEKYFSVNQNNPISDSDVEFTNVDDSDADKNYTPSNDSSDSDTDTNRNKELQLDKYTEKTLEREENQVFENKELKKSRKRTRKSDTWKQNKRKYLINTGQSYVTSGGRTKRAKVLQPPCGEKCKFKCTKMINHAKRQLIFKAFYEIGDKTRQRNFIVSCMEKIQERKYRNPKPGSTRTFSIPRYF